MVQTFPEIFRSGRRPPSGPKPTFRGDPELDVGEWNGIVRELANHEYDRYHVVLRWETNEALLAFIERFLKPAALEVFQMQMNWYMLGKMEKKPKLPAILTDG